ncbi:hypothetical protein BLOT_009888 [Blomia tropicalis]|nr:hypothetical protein BLOT_009888 [Blomia tropicalis]
MEQLLKNISKEYGRQDKIKEYCSKLSDQLSNNANPNKAEFYNSENLSTILYIFKIGISISNQNGKSSKSHQLGFDLLRLYVREINSYGTDGLKQKTVTRVIESCSNSLNGTLFDDIDNEDVLDSEIRLELMTLIIEIVTTYGAYLKMKHLVEIIETCQKQINQYVTESTKSIQSSRSGNASSSRFPVSSLFQFGSNSLSAILNATTTRTCPSIVNDKHLSTIYLTGGQACHYLVKNKLNDKPSCKRGTYEPKRCDIIHLFLYLCQKLQQILNIFLEMQTMPTTEDPNFVVVNNGNIEIICKLNHCFYLKCLHCILITIPDKWEQMTLDIAEITCNKIVPILIKILMPMKMNLNPPETSSSSSSASSSSNDQSHSSAVGRGAEKMTSATTNKDLFSNTLNYQERQFIYKISMEILRLFGMDASMRPLLESLFFHILLLPPLEQRLDSLIFVQEVFKNPSFLSILMLIPIEQTYNYTPSQNLNYLDLIKIFIDAIVQASNSDNSLLVQLSSICMRTLFNTMNNLVSRNQVGHETTLSKWLHSTSGENIIDCFFSNYYKYDSFMEQYDERMAKGTNDRLSDTKDPQQSISRKQIMDLKKLADRNQYKVQRKKGTLPESDSSKQPTRTQTPLPQSEQNQQQHKKPKRSYVNENFNYHDRLRELIKSDEQSSSLNSNDLEANEMPERLDLSESTVFEDQSSSSSDSTESDEEIKQISVDNQTLSSDNVAEVREKLGKLSLNTETDTNVEAAMGDDQKNEKNDKVSDKVSDKDQDQDSDKVSDKGNDEDNVNNVADIDESGSVSEYLSLDMLFNVKSDKNKSEDMQVDDDNHIYSNESLKKESNLSPARSLSSSSIVTDLDARIRNFERALANIYTQKLVKLIETELIYERNLVQIDESIQSFASNYCKHLFDCLKQMNIHNNQDSSMDNNYTHKFTEEATEEEISMLREYSYLVESLFINADGIYLATYSVLLLNVKLIYNEYYHDEYYYYRHTGRIPMTVADFIDAMFDYQTTIYLSSSFVAEIYENVLQWNFLETISDDMETFETISLVKLLKDVEIIDPSKPNAFKLSDYVRLEQLGRNEDQYAFSSTNERQNEIDRIVENQKHLATLIKCFLIHFSEQLFNCLSYGLNGKFSNYQTIVNTLESVNGTFISSACTMMDCLDKQSLGQLTCNSSYLQTMETLLNLFINVQFNAGLERLYELFLRFIMKPSSSQSDTFCFVNLRKSNTTPDLSATTTTITSTTTSTSTTSSSSSIVVVLTPQQFISIKTLLIRSGEVASHCPKIWHYVFDLCRFVYDLENFHSRSSYSSSILNRTKFSIETILRSNIKDKASLPSSSSSWTIIDSDTIGSKSTTFSSSFKTFPGLNEIETNNTEIMFNQLIDNIRLRNNEFDNRGKEMGQLIEYLTRFVEQIFEDVALKYNLSLVIGFIEHLGTYRCELKYEPKTEMTNEIVVDHSTGKIEEKINSFMLTRLVDVILRFVRNGRPLLHFMKIWPNAAKNLCLASAIVDQINSKKAITSMHKIIDATLAAYNEPEFFNFNESLFKPYEHLLYFELNDSSLEFQQELILNSIYEFVENSSNEIRSGWRAIFNSLKGLRLHENVISSKKISTLIDIFNAFFRTDNMTTISYASADFISCIFRLLRDITENTENPITIESNDVPNQQSNVHHNTDSNRPQTRKELFILLLKYVQRIFRLITNGHNLSDETFMIAPHVRARKWFNRHINLDLLKAKIDYYNLKEENDFGLNQIEHIINELSLKNKCNNFSASTHLWLLLFDEYANTIDVSSIEFRPILLEVFFALFQDICEKDETHLFVLNCFNHIIIPLMQSLLFKHDNLDIDHGEQYNDMKNSMEMFNDSIIKFIGKYFEDQPEAFHSESIIRTSIGLLLRQTLLIYIECLLNEYHQSIELFSLILLRRLMSSINRRIVSTYFWDIIIDCYRLGHKMTIHPFEIITSTAMYGKRLKVNNIVQLIIEKCMQKTDYTRKRAEQIFSIDQNDANRCGYLIRTQFDLENLREDYDVEVDIRNPLIFVNTTTKPRHKKFQSVRYNFMIARLHSHIVLNQIFGSLFTYNTKTSLTNWIGAIEPCKTDDHCPMFDLTWKQYQDICSCLKQSYDIAMIFDDQDELKMLVTFLCNKNTGLVNLHQLSALVWSLRFDLTFGLCMNKCIRNEKFSKAFDWIIYDLFTQYKYRLVLEMVVKYYCALLSNSGNQHPPVLTSTRKVDFQRKAMKNDKRLLYQDIQDFLKLWSNILCKCIELHIDIDDNDSFQFIMCTYRGMIGKFKSFKNFSNEQVHFTIEKWFERLALQTKEKETS